MAVLNHVIMFKFQEDTNEEKRAEIGDAVLKLKESCISEGTDEPYILSVVGGKNNGPEQYSVSWSTLGINFACN